MAGMTMGDYAKPAPSGGGIRLRILYDAIVNREMLEVVSGGKALIQTSDEVLEDMKKVIDGKMAFDSPNKTDRNNFVGKYSGKKVLKQIKKQGNKNVSTDIVLTKITKTTAFGSNKGSGGGASATALFEGAACWVLAYRYSLNTAIDVDYQITLEDFEKVKAKVFTTKSMEDIHQYLVDNPDWMKSSILTANKLTFYNDYVNDNFKFYRGTGIVDPISNHFRVVNKASGRPFSDINKWSPADIWMYDGSITDTSIFTNEMTFQGGYNKVLLDLLKEKRLIGVSLKKVEREATIKAYNFTRHSSRLEEQKKFRSIGSNSLYGSIDVYLVGEGYKTQFRDTAGDGSTWQGEIVGTTAGTSAKHGKIGGGVVNYLLESIYGEGNGIFKDYTSVSSIAIASKNGGLDRKLYTLANKRSSNVLKEGEVVDMNLIKNMPTQWKFSKYIGLMLCDILMGGNMKNRNEFTTKLYLYATSASDDSAPFIKVS
jgi:hypothetical protein